MNCAEYSSSRLVAIAVGSIAALIGAASVAACSLISNPWASWILLASGGLLLVVSAVAFTFRCVLKIDGDRGLVEWRTRALFWENHREIPIGRFEEVGIGMGSRGDDYGHPGAVYFVQLIGSRNLSVPGGCSDLEEIMSQAREISGHTQLPLDENPRMAVFGRRL